MNIQKSIFITAKSIVYIIIALLLFFGDITNIAKIAAVLLLISGVLTFLFGSNNKRITAVATRNYFNGVFEIIFGLLLFFSHLLPYKLSGIFALFFIGLAALQLGFALFASYKWVRSNQLVNILRLIGPLFAIIPSGLILGNMIENWGSQQTEVTILAVLFLFAGLFNLYYITIQGKIDYSKEKQKESA